MRDWAHEANVELAYTPFYGGPLPVEALTRFAVEVVIRTRSSRAVARSKLGRSTSRGTEPRSARPPDLHRRIADARSSALLRESAEILFRRMHDLSADVRESGRVWAEQELLDPAGADETLRRIETGMAAIQDEFAALLERQAEIVRELRGRA